MRAPKHIRQQKAMLLANAKADYHQNGAQESSHIASGSSAKGRAVNTGYRLSPDMRQGYQAHIHFSGGMGGNSKASQSLTSKQRSSKSDLGDAEYYTDKLDVTGGSRKEAQIRVGTTPARRLLLTDKVTGQKYLAKIPAQPKFANVGQTGLFPKDGGK